jgi:NAD(P)-dependent dehydrogenase (short-subunit alcohol dehydrogenase family)
MAPSKTIFITGASTGIGLASAKLFHSIGWNVVATMRNPTAEHELVKLDDPRMLVQRLDLQDLASIQPAIDAGIQKFSTIDVLLNNAGYGQNGLFEAIPREKIQEQFDVNLFGACCSILHKIYVTNHLCRLDGRDACHPTAFPRQRRRRRDKR